MGILKYLFGPSQKDIIWSKLAEDIGADYLDGELTFKTGEWKIALDTSTFESRSVNIIFTKMSALFLSKDNLNFNLSRKRSIFFWEKGILIGDSYFDKKFIIKGNNVNKIKMLFSDKKLRDLISLQPTIRLEILNGKGIFVNYYPEGVDRLYFECRGLTKDEKLLKGLFCIFTLILERLVQIDSAFKDDPFPKLEKFFDLQI